MNSEGFSRDSCVSGVREETEMELNWVKSRSAVCSRSFFRRVNRDKSFPPDLLFNLSFHHCHVGNTHSETRRFFHTCTKRLLKSFFHAADVYVISHQRCRFCSLIRAQTFTPRGDAGLYVGKKTLANKNSSERTLLPKINPAACFSFFIQRIKHT